VKPISVLCCALLCACSSGGSVLNMNSFYDVPIGATQEEVIASVGKPVATHRKEDGSTEYEYVERFKVGERNINERHYFILIKDGKVVSKRVKQSSPLPYGFDSYEMQTTQNDDPPFE
jgi:hypothetical protein